VYGDRGRSVNIGVKAGSKEKLDEVRTETIGLMRTIRNVKPSRDNDFSINETKVFEESIAKIRNIIWMAGIGLTMLSFIVGIIGIMNIMFVSVTERTKEIGIRKSMGAKKRSIWSQFLFESSALTLGGAVISIVFCSGLIYIARIAVIKFFPDISEVVEYFPPYLSMQLVVIATSVSVVLGIFAGLIPAIRASNLDPVNALRSE
jgi:putative ABC transport system permease protein